MSLFRSIVFSAVVSGLVAGSAITVVQYFGTVPLILKAETYEREQPEPATKPASTEPEHGAEDPSGHGQESHQHAVGEHDAHEHDAMSWKPAEGLQRQSLTAAANVLTAIGFALLLAALYALRGRAVTWHEGLLWGLSGFIVFTIAPGLGLPPELPGIPAAPLEQRQLWWITTAAATASGLGMIFLQRSAWAALLGICLLVLPHLFGAPQLSDMHTEVPDALSHQFLVAVTITNLMFWALLGCVTSITYGRFAARG